MKTLVFLFFLPWLAVAQQPRTITVQSIDMSTNSRPYEVVPMSAFVSASELRVPARARKEFEKANESLSKDDLDQALRRLKKAVSLYPDYASAYNNMGVVYARLGEPAPEREALQRAVGLNDHFALAYLNVGRMEIAAGDFPDSVTALHKALALDAGNATTLILLAYAELEQGQSEEAIAISRKAHALPKPHAFAHRVAARAFVHEKQISQAVSELQVSLDEEPTGPRADAVRTELKVLKTALH